MSMAEVEHVFEEPGEYRFMCHVHRGGGHDRMTGRIVVE
jgi:plastocyanin